MTFAAILAVSLVAAVGAAVACEHFAAKRETRWDDETFDLSTLEHDA